jgi:hypothetical protein
MYAVWSALAPYLDVRTLLAVRGVHRDARHPMPRDASAVLVRLTLNKGGQVPRTHVAEGRDGTVVLRDVTFKGLTAFGSLVWGRYDTTTRARVGRYLGLRTCAVDTSGRVTWHDEARVVCASYFFVRGRMRMLCSLCDGTHFLFLHVDPDKIVLSVVDDARAP